MKFFDAAQKPIRLGNMVGQGGEASVYQVAGHAEVLAKIFQPAPRANYQAKLGWMIEHPPENPTRSLSHPSLAWPSEMLFDPNRRLAGYLMPYIRQAVPALEVFNPRRRAAVLPEFDTRYLYRVARNLEQSGERAPTTEEIADEMGLEPRRVEWLMELARRPVSLEKPVGEEEDSELGDLLVDQEGLLCGWCNNLTGERIIARGNDEKLSEIAFSSMHIIDSEIFTYMSDGIYSMTPLYLRLASTHKIYTLLSDSGYWFNTGTPEILEEVRKFVK